MSGIEVALVGFVCIVLAAGLIYVLVTMAGDIIVGRADWVETILTVTLYIIVGLGIYWVLTGKMTK